jgi:putative hydrolase of the HAD superfamily
MRWRAVVFDLGGVVLGSPLHAIAAYERERAIPAGAINRIVVATGPGGAWSRLERGELRRDEFYPAFEGDCAAAGVTVGARDLMERVAAIAAPRPAMLAAIARIRARGIAAGALTNNWIGEDDGMAAIAPHFDAVIESRVVGLRKPDPRIYRLVCETLGVAPAETVFLDDIGGNLKPARALGMATIRVADPEQALGELESLLGFPLR